METIMQAVTAKDKRVVNGTGDINQLAPFKYPWAYEFWLNANKNHWMPFDINMLKDVEDYNYVLDDSEKHVFENVLAYLTTSDILAMRNIAVALLEKMTAPELQLYQARQIYEESLHSVTYQHCIETIGLDQEVIYNKYRIVPEINAKIKMTNQMIDPLIGYDVDLSDREKLQDFLLGYIFFSAIFEGSWFYNGFSPIYSLQRRGLMKGTGEQLQYIQRDETLHASFGIRVIKQLMLEENIRPDLVRLKRMVDMADEVEKNYINYILPEPIKGYNAEDHHGQYRFILNRRFRQLGFEEPYKNISNKLPWLDEQASIRKEKNFFETRVTEYQTGVGLDWSK